MKVEHIQPFVSAAALVLREELGLEVERGELSVANTDYTTREVTVLIGITGQLEGTVLYGSDEALAVNIVYELTGERKVFFDDTCESAIAELGNVISGRAAVLFESQGIDVTISPPSIIRGRGTIISTVNITRLIIPLRTRLGDLDIAVALRERS
ncbi:MAG: chemotaxis protein CheX [Limnochordales bacterium]|nr:chemotaxis protein CheX [Limnochordales bacterium]